MKCHLLSLANMIFENMAFSADHTYCYRTQRQVGLYPPHPPPAVSVHAGWPKTFPREQASYHTESRREDRRVLRGALTPKRKGEEGAGFHRFPVSHHSASTCDSTSTYVSADPAAKRETGSVRGAETPTQHPAPPCCPGRFLLPALSLLTWLSGP